MQVNVNSDIEIMGTDRKTEEAHKKSLGVSIDAGGDNGMNPE